MIDGLSQSAFIGEDTNPYGPEIEINGENAGENAKGFDMVWGSLELTHVIINRFPSAGVSHRSWLVDFSVLNAASGSDILSFIAIELFSIRL